MKKLDVLEMENYEGGLDKATKTMCYSSGALAASALVFTAFGIATGGVGFGIAAGVSAYFGTTTGLLCAMM